MQEQIAKPKIEYEQAENYLTNLTLLLLHICLHYLCARFFTSYSTSPTQRCYAGSQWIELFSKGEDYNFLFFASEIKWDIFLILVNLWLGFHVFFSPSQSDFIPQEKLIQKTLTLDLVKI